jgi:disulfide bond formation protein DsbB
VKLASVREQRLAGLLALLVPAGLLAGALVAQYGFGLPPCEMCWWQRYACIVAVILAAAAWVTGSTALVRLAAAAIAVGGLIGGFHAGVEYGWWQGLTRCASSSISGDPLSAIMNSPLVRCDVAAWRLFGISLAGWNFLISLAAAAAIMVLLGRGRSVRRVTA